MVDLSVEICGLKLKNPIVLSSGPLTASSKGVIRAAKEGFGAVVTKSVCLEEKHGHPHPRIVDVRPYYMINAVGLENKGVRAFTKEIKEIKENVDIPLIVSIFAKTGTVEEFCEVAKIAEEAGADMLELNVSCQHPTHREYGFFLGHEIERIPKITKAVRNSVKIPITVKLPSYRILEVPLLAKAVEEAGGNAVTVVNTLPALLIDVNTAKPKLGNPHGIGGLSGPAVKPIAVRCIADTARMIKIPIMGTGGASNGMDVIEMMMVGASAVQIHTIAMWKGLSIVKSMINEIEKFLEDKGYKSVREIIGLALKNLPKKPIQFEGIEATI